jgi:hypothetical protein
LVSPRIRATVSGSIGEASCSQLRLTNVSAAAICSSLSVARFGISRLNPSPLTVIGPRTPLRTMRMQRSSGPMAHSDPTRGGASPASPIPSGL